MILNFNWPYSIISQVNPSDAGIYDRVVVQDLIKTIAQTTQLDSEKMKEFKVVVLTGQCRNVYYNLKGYKSNGRNSLPIKNDIINFLERAGTNTMAHGWKKLIIQVPVQYCPTKGHSAGLCTTSFRSLQK